MQILEPSPRITADFVSSDAATAGPPLNDDLRWQLAMRIAASTSMGRSQLLSDFLLYIVDRSIRGRTDEITEQQIGVSVFGRPQDYDSNDDNIVRSYARKLRKRIEEYFASEGSEETLRLEIPRGGYAPVFWESTEPLASASAVTPNPVTSSPVTSSQGQQIVAPELTVSTLEMVGEPLPVETPPVKKTPAFLHKVAELFHFTPATILALVLGILLGVSGMLLMRAKSLPSREEVVSHSLWIRLFNKNQDTFIVPCDVGLVIMQRLIERPVPLTTYINGNYRSKVSLDQKPDPSEILKLGSRRFTNVVDLDFVAHLAQLKEIVPERMMVRYARDLRMDDLRMGNAILIGSDEANPWLELFQPQLYFAFRYESDPNKLSGFVNRFPQAGEQAIYSTSGHEEQTFGIIAYLPNLENKGHVVILAGLNTAGTEAAAKFLLDPSSMMQAIQRATTPSGDIQPFELLISAGSVATNASTPHIVLERIGLPPAH